MLLLVVVIIPFPFLKGVIGVQVNFSMVCLLFVIAGVMNESEVLCCFKC